MRPFARAAASRLGWLSWRGSSHERRRQEHPPPRAAGGRPPPPPARTAAWLSGRRNRRPRAPPWPAAADARPSFLAGNRELVGQPERGGEKLALRVSHWLRPLIPANYRSIEAAKVAKALLRHVPQARGRLVLMSGTMQRGV